MMNKIRLTTFILVPMLMMSAVATAQEYRKKAPEGVRLYIIAPENGATVRSPVTVKFGLSGMGVAPAGVARENTGHHHVLINTDVKDIDATMPLPANANIKHFGGGQTEARLDLPPGQHTLLLMIGDENHVPFNPPIVSDKITITVQ